MSSPTTKPSTRRLSDVARHVVVPAGAVSTGWPAVHGKCADLGISFRWWQPLIGRIILAKRADGKYAATVGGVGMSIPRQVGKTFLVGAIVFALCLLFPNLTVIWTAHQLRTAEETFGKMLAFAKRKKIAPYILKTPTASGEEAIIFRNGSRILFGARERGFGLGFDEVDVLILDEAQRVTAKTLDDMLPATNQSRHPSGALVFYMGTPPRPTDAGEAFRRMRSEALSGEDVDSAWIELGADPDFRPTEPPSPLTDADWAQVAKANVSYPVDTPPEAILRMRKHLGAESFRREALGIWDDVPDSNAFPRGAWQQLADPASSIAERPFLALSMTPDHATVTLVAAGRRADGQFHVEILHHGRAGDWITAETVRIAREQGSEVAIVRSHPVGSLASDLDNAGLRVRTLTSGDYIRACGAFYNAVVAGTVHYLPPQPELDGAVSRATRKTVGESWRWAGDDISALVAASQAYYAAFTFVPVGSGRAVALN